ncbi:MAG: penicillin acylase family protein, partial [Verrucomicrobia bacterium]|nr:penicillin acylase family protein [Verrucomicrobiota bacterium]
QPTPRRLTIYDSADGPVIARKADHVYAAKLAYADEVQFVEVFYEFNFARDIRGIQRGLALDQIMPQNVMAADTRGNIFYMRAGRVPIRPPGFNFFRPVDGSTAKTAWRGIHPARDLYQVLNPPQGYMQNCNIPPDVMMVGSPMTPERKPAYLFGERPGWLHQRAARAVEILSQATVMTPERALATALDSTCYGYDRWVAALRAADKQFGADWRQAADYQAALQQIADWNGRAAADSFAALKFYYWRQAVNQILGNRPASELAAKINDYMAVERRGRTAAEPLTEAEQRGLVAGLARGMAALRRQHGRLDVRYGEVFRVGRDDRSWPVGGGSLTDEGMATLRAVHFGPERPDHTRWGGGGQTSTQVVLLTRPIRSWTQPPIGQSDHPDSPFYRDQAEKLFSPGRMKPTWYTQPELLAHVFSREELHPPF